MVTSTHANLSHHTMDQPTGRLVYDTGLPPESLASSAIFLVLLALLWPPSAQASEPLSEAPDLVNATLCNDGQFSNGFITGYASCAFLVSFLYLICRLPTLIRRFSVWSERFLCSSTQTDVGIHNPQFLDRLITRDHRVHFRGVAGYEAGSGPYDESLLLLTTPPAVMQGDAMFSVPETPSHGTSVAIGNFSSLAAHNAGGSDTAHSAVIRVSPMVELAAIPDL